MLKDRKECTKIGNGYYVANSVGDLYRAEIAYKSENEDRDVIRSNDGLIGDGDYPLLVCFIEKDGVSIRRLAPLANLAVELTINPQYTAHLKREGIDPLETTDYSLTTLAGISGVGDEGLQQIQLLESLRGYIRMDDTQPAVKAVGPEPQKAVAAETNPPPEESAFDLELIGPEMRKLVDRLRQEDDFRKAIGYHILSRGPCVVEASIELNIRDGAEHSRFCAIMKSHFRENGCRAIEWLDSVWFIQEGSMIVGAVYVEAVYDVLPPTDTDNADRISFTCIGTERLTSLFRATIPRSSWLEQEAVLT